MVMQLKAKRDRCKKALEEIRDNRECWYSVKGPKVSSEALGEN